MLKFFVDCFGKLFTPGAKLTQEERRTTTLVSLVLALLLVLVVIVAAGRAAAAQASADAPAWETALQARVILGRLVASLGVWVIGVLAAVLTYQVLDNTRLGKWLLHWDYEDGMAMDPPGVQAAKTRAAGLLLAALLVAAAVLFGGVLR